jgi:hypothetical protein
VKLDELVLEGANSGRNRRILQRYDSCVWTSSLRVMPFEQCGAAVKEGNEVRASTGAAVVEDWR